MRISTPVSGIVAKVFVQPGTRVKKGDPLVQFDGREAQLKLDAAQSQVAAAEADLAIADVRSSDNDPVNKLRVQKAKADLKFAQSQSELARLGLDALTIRSPRDGTVTEVTAAEGAYVNGLNQPLVIIRE
jgi:multidrug resistance efflux pump